MPDRNEEKIISWAENHISRSLKKIKSLKEERTNFVTLILEKVLNAFSEEKVGSHHFSSVSGYGHGDEGRGVIDRIYAKVLGADSAAVRMQFVSGTHAISAALFGILRPGDSLLSLTGRPYDTLEEVIGLNPSGIGSLIDFGIKYDEISLQIEGKIDFKKLDKALVSPVKVVFIQRSCGYSSKSSLLIKEIQDICNFVHKKDPQIICFVDNCYGEFVEISEPCDVGADLVAGSLIKNLGGTITPTGGYVAGRTDLVEKACARLTAPGIGIDSGTSFGLNRIILQGLFLAPQMTAEALIGADLVACVFEDLGFDVNPSFGEKRGDIIQSVCFGNQLALQAVCRAFQSSSPVGSYLDPVPSIMPGYASDLIMAGGTFIDGSTSEFSADAPLRPPYNLYIQGGTHHAHQQIALRRALCQLVKEDLLTIN